MMVRSFFIISVVGILWVGFFSLPLLGSQETTDHGAALGEWEMEVNAGGEYFYLSFSIEKTDAGLTGSISESSGFFSDVPLENVEFDGTNLRFEMNIPTPPDGYENLVKTDLELVEDRLEGTLSVESLGISAAATAKKKTELFGKASYAIIPFPKTANFVFIAIFESSGLIQPS